MWTLSPTFNRRSVLRSRSLAPTAIISVLYPTAVLPALYDCSPSMYWSQFGFPGFSSCSVPDARTPTCSMFMGHVFGVKVISAMLWVTLQTRRRRLQKTTLAIRPQGVSRRTWRRQSGYWNGATRTWKIMELVRSSWRICKLAWSG